MAMVTTTERGTQDTARAAVLQSGTTTLGPAWHKRVAGLHVLRVKGSHREMGRQHGVLLRDAVRTGPIPYYRHLVKRLMGRSLGPASGLVFPVVQGTVGRHVARGLPAFARETLEGLAEGAGLDPAAYLQGCTMPDSLLWLAARMMQLRGTGPAVEHRLALGLGCTSGIAWGASTVDGRLLHARNLDYYGVGNWPSHQAVIFAEPDDGMRYASVSAAGVPMGGFTAMNEAGLTLTVHQHMFTDRTSLGGTPIGIIGDEVMRRAHDLDEAQAILSANRPIGCWTYLVADGNRNEVLCFEESPQRKAPRRTSTSDSTFGYANIYLDGELGSTEKNLYGSYWRHNLARHQRTQELLDRGSHDARSMAGILADTGDTSCRVHHSISMMMTVASVVFRPSDGTFWVGSGEAPTSHGTFIPFNLARADVAEEEGAFPGGPPPDDAGRRAFEHLRRAYVRYVDDADVPAALAEAAQACALQPRQSVYHALRGLLALQAGEPSTSVDAFTQALGTGHPDPERVAGFHLWRGRARDVLGRRAEAVEDYRRALSLRADEPVHAAARRGEAARWPAWKARMMNVDMALMDVITP